MERRFTSREGHPVSVTKRADGVRILTGYAAVFYRAGDPGTEYALWDCCVERIAPGAFDRAISEDDVRALFNHNQDHVLGRTKSKTCRLSVDTVGLRYEVELPDPTCPENLPQLIDRGDISGCSFSFACRSVEWTSQPDGIDVRLLKDVQLFDVGPVTFPAYEATSVGMRALSDLTDLRKEHQQIRSRRSHEREAEEIAIRQRLVLLDAGS